MLNTKGKRKLTYRGNTYYWYVKPDGESPKIYIMSEDKKIQLCCGFDRETTVSSRRVIDIIERHLQE